MRIWGQTSIEVPSWSEEKTRCRDTIAAMRSRPILASLELVPTGSGCSYPSPKKAPSFDRYTSCVPSCDRCTEIADLIATALNHSRSYLARPGVLDIKCVFERARVRNRVDSAPRHANAFTSLRACFGRGLQELGKPWTEEFATINPVQLALATCAPLLHPRATCPPATALIANVQQTTYSPERPHRNIMNAKIRNVASAHNIM
eukprot:365759-Chlamydomonas_euryale.AAC.6